MGKHSLPPVKPEGSGVPRGHSQAGAVRRFFLKGAKTLAQPRWTVASLRRLQSPLWSGLYCLIKFSSLEMKM